MTTLPLSDIVNISVILSPASAVGSNFNLGLIVGTSNIIAGTSADRVRIYSSTNAMISDGFTADMPEYKAAQLYFSQVPQPQQVAIGRQISGAETPLQAVQACRVANTDWYVCTVCGLAKADIEAVAGYIEAAVPLSAYAYTTADTDVLNNVAGNVAKTLQAAGYMRTFGQYSTQTADAVAAIMGYAMGANTGMANSAYTLAFKSEVGVIPETLTDTQATVLKGQNINYYANYGNAYNLFEPGVTANGMWFDELLGVDKLVTKIQAAVMALLTQYSKIPQTSDGMALLVNAIISPCEDALTSDFIAPGIWNAPAVMSLNTGDTLSRGYKIMSASIDTQSEADRAARIAPPTYVCIKLAGAIQYVNIQVNVN